MERIPIIKDKVAQNDAFGPHTRIAKTILDHIQNSEDADSIGLEGDWGTGKSTILNFLKEDLEKNAVHFFTYDAWAHEDDNIRKSFLDELNESITFDADKKKKLRTQIWSDTEIETVSNRSSLPIGAKLFTLSVALLPAFGYILSVLEESPQYKILWFDINLTSTNPWLATSTIFGFFIPPLILLTGFFLALYRTGKNPKSENLAKNFKEVFRLVITDSEVTIGEKTISSSSSFRKFKGDLVAIVNQKSPKVRKIVVAIDNIDRLEPETARALWSSLTPFFERAKNDKALKNLWLIMPFSKTHLKSVFENGSTEWVDDENGLPKLQPQYKENQTDGFISKSFDLIFNVPKALVWKWKNFLSDRLREVFTELSEVEVAKIILLYNHSITNPPTPRKLNQFVNNLLVTHLQAADPSATPISAVAAYILFCNPTHYKGGQHEGTFQLEARVESFLNLSDYKVHMAALTYGVSLDDAPSAYLATPISAALSHLDSEALQQLSSFPDFGQVLAAEIMYSLENDGELYLLEQKAELINSLDYEDSHAVIWEKIANVVPVTPGWSAIEDWAKLINIVSANLKHTDQKANFFTSISQTLSKIDFEEAAFTSDDRDTAVKQWLAAADLVSTNAAPVAIPVDQDLMVSIVNAYVADKKSKPPKSFFISPFPNESTIFNSQDFNFKSVVHIVFVAMLMKHYGFQNKVFEPTAKLLEELEDTSNISLTHAASIISTLIALVVIFEDTEARTAIEDIIESVVGREPSYQHHSPDIDGEYSKTFYWSAAFIAAVVIDVEHPDMTISEKLGNSDEVFVDDVLEIIVSYFLSIGSPELLLQKAALNDHDFQFCADILCKVINKVERLVLSASLFTENPRFYKTLNDHKVELFSDLILKASNQAQFVSDLVSIGFQKPLTDFYCGLVDQLEEAKPALLDFLTEALTPMEKEDWLSGIKAHLNNEISTVSIALKLKSLRENFEIGIHLRDAIEEIAREQFSSPDNDLGLNNTFMKTLMSLLSNDTRKNCQDDILDNFLENKSPQTLRLLDEKFAFEDFERSAIQSKADQLLHIIDIYLRQRHESDISATEHLARICEVHPMIYSKAKAATKKGFRERLKSARSDDDQKYTSSLNRIVKAFKIRGI